jgi:KipI family sensor histidine kinase inhibitor
MNPSTGYRIVRAGDSTLVIQFENRIDPAVNARAISLAHAVGQAAIDGVRDIVPTYRTVAVCFEPLKTNVQALIERIEQEAAGLPDAPSDSAPPLRVPVCYGGEHGPDLLDVARFAGMSPEEVVAVHRRATYRVYMLGFLPGFAYMGLVDDRIAAPRHASPRVRVPKGSVGIAGRQTGIYPSDAPGGWQLIGKTPIEPFSIERPAPFLFKPGDAVQFVPVDRVEFERLVRLKADADWCA